MPTKSGKSPGPKPDLPVKRFRSQAAWQKWLETNHERTRGVWIEFAKKASGVASVNYKEALEVALCYGWIDGQTASVDETWYRQRFTPRRPRSKWSQINRASVERLHDAKRPTVLIGQDVPSRSTSFDRVAPARWSVSPVTNST